MIFRGFFHCELTVQVAGSIIGKGGANISKLRNQVSVYNNSPQLHVK